MLVSVAMTFKHRSPALVALEEHLLECEAGFTGLATTRARLTLREGWTTVTAIFGVGVRDASA